MLTRMCFFFLFNLNICTVAKTSHQFEEMSFANLDIHLFGVFVSNICSIQHKNSLIAFNKSIYISVH